MCRLCMYASKHIYGRNSAPESPTPGVWYDTHNPSMVVLSSIQIYLLCQDGLTFRTFDALLQKGGKTDLNAKKKQRM